VLMKPGSELRSNNNGMTKLSKNGTTKTTSRLTEP
jgi:hypothetical protein